MEFEKLSNRVIGCCIEVHKELGPGLLESAYEQSLAHELRLQNIPFEIQKPMPVEYKGVKLNCGYRLDIVVNNELILELKAVDSITGVHKAQLLTYLKLSGINKGLLINFNVSKVANGIKRFVL